VNFTRLPLEDDARLRDLLVESSHLIEAGMHMAGGLLPIGGGRSLDLLAIDSQARLTVLEVRCQEPPGWLLDALDHYDWACGHLEEISQLYPQHALDSARRPRLLFICSTFSDDFRRRLAHLRGAPIQLFEYRYLEVNGVRGLYFEPVGIPHLATAEPPALLQDHLDALEPERGPTAERLVARLAALDPGVRLRVHRGGILLLWEDRLVALLEFSRGGVQVIDDALGRSLEVRRAADIEPALAAVGARLSHLRRMAAASSPSPAARPAARGFPRPARPTSPPGSGTP
jgi:hypothetical protein